MQRTIKRALITGVCGFTGGYLAWLLLENDAVVCGVDIRKSLSPLHRGLKGRIALRTLDLLDERALRRAVDGFKPDCIFHLAAVTQGKPADMDRMNVEGTRMVLDAAGRIGAKVLVAGSSAEYGRAKKKDLPLAEDASANPVSPYGESKLAQTSLALGRFAETGLPVFVTRAFNLVGPGQAPAFVCGAIAEQVRNIRDGRADPVISVGDLRPKRDFVDVRDAVRAYVLAVEKGRPGEIYNVCSGRAVSIRTAFRMLVKLGGLKKVTVSRSPGRLRPVDVPVQVGDFTKIRKTTGWKPGIPLEQSLRDMLE